MNLKSLIGKLNDSTRGALEAAAGLCLARTHYDIEVEHYLTKLLDSTDNDVAAIFKHFEIDTSRFSGELARALDKLKSGNARTPALSPTLIRMLTRGLDHWLDRLRCRTGPHRIHHSRPGDERRTGTAHARCEPRVSEDSGRSAAQGLCVDRRQFERRGSRPP